MIAFAADENFNNDILRALIRRRPGLDVLGVGRWEKWCPQRDSNPCFRLERATS
jgi:hypothetical protein